MRAELAEEAFDFCAAHGFEQVTTDEIAQGIGISRATFFRYFRSKEDAIVTAARSTRIDLGESLLALPPRAGEPALDAVRRALAPTVEAARANPTRIRARHRMITGSPALRARLASDRAEQQRALADALATVIHDRVMATAVATVSMAAIDLGWTLWAAKPEADLGEQVERAFELVTRVGGVALDSPAL